ncbi:MAG: ribosomal RNA small subunit methyltransferase A [Clostridia bacterium]|nr:ribosomal RNA small subunit methyltransferase A [Clostridia bacterium]MBQ7223985.1 ribosomal RNA small subunit methyltransferase A [Clostridia bacterium]
MDILSTLKKHGFSFSKKYGQNFITDTNLLDAIADDASVTSEDTVLEIGAGAGTLTGALAKKAKRVIAFEIDRSLESVLDETLAPYDNVEVIMDDVTKWTDEEIDDLVGGEYKVVANLPYYITTPLLFMFLERKRRPTSITVMVQKEVAERICATEKKGDYGALSVSVALRADAQITRVVKRDMFTPPPNVDSAVVRIDMLGGIAVKDEKTLFTLVKKAFAMKRKTLVNNLSAGYGMSKADAEEIITSIGLKPTARAEELSKEQFITLADALFERK